MKQAILITGRARDVFPKIKLLAEKAGRLTIAELVRLKELKERVVGQ